MAGSAFATRAAAREEHSREAAVFIGGETTGALAVGEVVGKRAAPEEADCVGCAGFVGCVGPGAVRTTWSDAAAVSCVAARATTGGTPTGRRGGAEETTGGERGVGAASMCAR